MKTIHTELVRLGLTPKWESMDGWIGCVVVCNGSQAVHVVESDVLDDLEPYQPDTPNLEVIIWGIMEANEAACPESE